MATKEELEKYYEYRPADGGKWYLKDPPAPEPWFQAELTLFGGVSDRGQPNLRVSWAGTLMSDITERPQLKYFRIRSINAGYNYVKTDGTIGVTPSMNLPKDAKVPWEFHPRTDRRELGRLRWVIERHVPAHELLRLGRFQHRYAQNGELILRELPPEGVYDHFFWVQTAAHKYRGLDNEVLTAIKYMHQYNINTSEMQKALDDYEREQNQILVGEKESREIWAAL